MSCLKIKKSQVLNFVTALSNLYKIAQVKDIMDEVNRKDAQLKLLVEFIGILGDLFNKTEYLCLRAFDG